MISISVYRQPKVDIRYTDIMAALTEYLRHPTFREFNNGEELEIIEVLKDFPRPSFFTEMEILSTDRTLDYLDDVIMLTIHYFPSSRHINEVENIVMQDNLKRFFLLELDGLFEVKGVKFLIENFELIVVDGVVQCNFTIQVNQRILKDENKPLMKTLFMGEDVVGEEEEGGNENE